ncbi:MAG: MerR family transcriptional regulator [Eubacteriaceae bacterium]|nr:MerR family transcriptional regulator [Eubacteriaceae bacterium]
MRIGTFAKKYSLHVSTVRYYVKLGLIIPKKDGAQYDFSKKNGYEMDTVLKLRDMGFTLQEMYTYINTLRVFASEDQNLYKHIVPLLDSKKAALTNELSTIHSYIHTIDSRLEDIQAENKIENKQIRRGIPTEFLGIMACPVCGSPLYLENSSIMQNQILSATCSCTCGYEGIIENGIFYTDRDNDLDSDPVFQEDYFGEPDENGSSDMAFFEILKDGNSEYLTVQHKVREWMYDAALEHAAEKRVFLFPDIAALFLYLYSDAKFLKDSLIIVMGLSKKSMELIQNHLFTLKNHLNIVFVVSPDHKLPVRRNSIDIMIDYLGSFSCAFYTPQLLYPAVDAYFAEDSVIIGSMDHYKPGARSNDLAKELYTHSAEPFLTLAQQKAILKDFDYSIIKDSSLEAPVDSAIFIDYHSPDDQRYSYVYLAERNKK